MRTPITMVCLTFFFTSWLQSMDHSPRQQLRGHKRQQSMSTIPLSQPPLSKILTFESPIERLTLSQLGYVTLIQQTHPNSITINNEEALINNITHRWKDGHLTLQLPPQPTRSIIPPSFKIMIGFNTLHYLHLHNCHGNSGSNSLVCNNDFTLQLTDEAKATLYLEKLKSLIVDSDKSDASLVMATNLAQDQKADTITITAFNGSKINLEQINTKSFSSTLNQFSTITAWGKATDQTIVAEGINYHYDGKNFKTDKTTVQGKGSGTLKINSKNANGFVSEKAQCISYNRQAAMNIERYTLDASITYDTLAGDGETR